MKCYITISRKVEWVKSETQVAKVKYYLYYIKWIKRNIYVNGFEKKEKFKYNGREEAEEA